MEKFFKNVKNTVMLGVGLAVATPAFSAEKDKVAMAVQPGNTIVVHDKNDASLEKNLQEHIAYNRFIGNRQLLEKYGTIKGRDRIRKGTYFTVKSDILKAHKLDMFLDSIQYSEHNGVADFFLEDVSSPDKLIIYEPLDPESNGVLVVHDKNDPRLKAYEDSLQKYKKIVSFPQMNPITLEETPVYGRAGGKPTQKVIFKELPKQQIIEPVVRETKTIHNPDEYSVVNNQTKFITLDGKTKIPYIEKVYYSKTTKQVVRTEKVDPITGDVIA